jgi:hypothetical protein
LSPLRWPLLFCLSNTIIFISSSSLALTPASLYLARAYKVSDLELSFCNNIYSFSFVPMTFVGMWLYKVMPVQNVIRLSCSVILIGCWFRVLTGVSNSFTPVLMGQVIISLAYPLVTNVMTRFSNTWFPDSERSIVTSVLGLSIPTGNLIAFLMSGIIFAGIEE